MQLICCAVLRLIGCRLRLKSGSPHMGGVIRRESKQWKASLCSGAVQSLCTLTGMTLLSDTEQLRRTEVKSVKSLDKRTSDPSPGARNGRAKQLSRMDRRPRMTDNNVDEPMSNREEVITGDADSVGDGNGRHRDWKDTPLHIAVRNADYTMLAALHQEDVEIDARDASGKTAVHLAFDQRDLGLLEMLLPFKPDLNIKDPNGNAPLHLTISAGWEYATKLLLLQDIDIDATNEAGNTALHLACLNGYREVVSMLLESGADVSIRDRNGRTALQLAVTSRTPRLPELLLQYGADIDDVVPHRGVSADGEDTESLAKEDPATQVSHKTEQDSIEETGPSGVGFDLTELGGDHWDGVRRDNGDGFILANYDKHDIFFDAKMEAIRLFTHEGQEMHAIQLKLNFMKPFLTRNRIRYAKVDVRFATVSSGQSPHIHSIMPQADRVEVSEQEISSGQTFTVGASGNGGPSSVNISMEGSKSRKSTFKGVRIIHGVVKDRMHASWRMYEEPGSQSGLPEIVRLLLVVQCKTEFDIRLSMSVKSRHFLSLGIPRTLTARTKPPYRVPNVTTMLKLERAMKLKNMLNVADRAATTVQEARMLEKEFTRSVQNHTNKALIMEASRDPEFVQEWTDIAAASRLGDFSIMHDKLMRMEVAERRRRLSERIVIVPERKSAQIDIDVPIRNRSPSPRVSRRIHFGEDREYDDREPIRRRSDAFLSRDRRYNSGESSEQIDIEVPIRDLSLSPRRNRRIYSRGDREYYDREPRRRRADEYLSRDQRHNSQAKNAMESFSAVGPGYKVSRLA